MHLPPVEFAFLDTLNGGSGVERVDREWRELRQCATQQESVAGVETVCHVLISKHEHERANWRLSARSLKSAAAALSAARAPLGPHDRSRSGCCALLGPLRARRKRH